MLQVKLRGSFYNAFDDDAKVIAQVMGYKVKEQSTGRLRAGFPADSIDKVRDELSACDISFVACHGDDEVARFDSENDRYNEYLSYFDNAKIVHYEGKSSGNNEDIKKKAVKGSFDDIPLDIIDFISSLCEGKNPHTGESANSISLNDAKNVRMFFRIRDLLKGNK